MGNYLQKIVLLSSLLFFVSLSLVAQTKISGTITDYNGRVLSGASISIINTNQGTLSDDNGLFELEVSEVGKYDIVISYLGRKVENRQIEVNNTPYILDLQLTPDP